MFKLFQFKYIQKIENILKFFFNLKANKYTKIIWKNKNYFIETTYIPYIDIDNYVQIKLTIWYYDKVIWFKFKKLYHITYIISSIDSTKKSIEKELIKVFGLELEKLFRIEKRKEEIRKLINGE